MKRKILYLSPSNRLFGARISLLTLLKYLNRRKYEPIVVSPDNSDGLLQELEKIKVKYYPLRLWNWRKGKYLFKIPFAIYKLSRIIKMENISLIHSNEFWCNPYAVVTGKFIYKLPIVTHIRLNINLEKAKKYLLKYSDKIICVSKATSKLLSSWEYKNKVITIYNGLDFSDFCNYEEKRKNFRKEFGLDDDTILIGEIAQIDERKNQLKVVEIIPYILKKYKNIKFFFIGDSRNKEYEIKVRKKVRELNIEKYCSFIGFRSDIPNVCAGIDIVILPSSIEGFGRAIIEAMYMFTPAIGSNVGGIPEVIEHGITGFIFKYPDFDEMRKYLEILIESPEKRLQMGINARKRVKMLFSAETSAESVMKVYNELLKE